VSPWLPRWLARRASPELTALREAGFVALDLETTGLDARRDAVVSVAAVPFLGGQPRPGYATLVNPERPIPPASTAIHGLTDDMVAAAPRIDRVLAALDDVLDGTPVLAGHGVDFDLAVLERERRQRGLPRLAIPALDTLLLAAALNPGWPDYTLERVASRAGVEVVGRHTAEGDALTAGRILLALLPALEGRGFRTVGELLWLQRQTRAKL